MSPTATVAASSANGQVTKRTTSDLLQASDDVHPTLIIIFGWLGAKAPTLRKYSDSYRKLYPSSAQMVVNSDPLRFWKLAFVRERALQPVVRDLEGHISQTQDGRPPRILLHVMSNGGTRRGLRAPDGTKCAIVFDSAPAPVTFSIMNRAFTAGIRSRIMSHRRILFRVPRPMQREMAALNDPGLFPWTSTRTPRMYLYSSGDQVVPAPGVEEHAAKARAAGFPVRMVHFDRSAHVAHARDDPEKYWGSIKTFWEEVTS